jgi:hypothetical protein
MAGLHRDRWLGPAPWFPSIRPWLNNSWWFDYGDGTVTNWAIHHVDSILRGWKLLRPEAEGCGSGQPGAPGHPTLPCNLNALADTQRFWDRATQWRC